VITYIGTVRVNGYFRSIVRVRGRGDSNGAPNYNDGDWTIRAGLPLRAPPSSSGVAIGIQRVRVLQVIEHFDCSKKWSKVYRAVAGSISLATGALGVSACSTSHAVPITVADAGCSNTLEGASAARRTSSYLDDNPAWVSGAPPDATQQYVDSASRDSDYYDSDISGAPPHVSAGSGHGPHVSNSCSKPANSGRKPSSIISVPTNCWYQALQPGVHDPQHDLFLGCEYLQYDTSGFTSLAMHGGAKGIKIGFPVDGAACAGSPMTIADDIHKADGSYTEIADINALWNGNKVEGWMYLGDDGNRYVQKNYSNQSGVQWSISIGEAVQGGVGVSSPGAYSGITPWNGQFPPGTSVRKCFVKGKQLV
jgi:hypothetical protein